MDELLQEFLAETGESLDVADAELVRFERDPNNAEILNNIFRLVHTIKGTCGFIGLSRLAALAHAAETLMGKFRDGRPVTVEAVSLVLVTIDRIKWLLAEIASNGGREPVGDDVDLIGRLDALSGEGSALPAPDSAAPHAAAPPPPDETPDGAAPGALESLLHPDAAPPLAAEPMPSWADDAPPVLDEFAPDDTRSATLEQLFRMEVASAVTPVSSPAREAEPSASAAREAVVAGARSASPAAGRRGDENTAPPAPATQAIRVSVEVLEQLMTMMSELVLTRNQLMDIARRTGDSEYKTSLQRLSNVTGELQEAVMRARMQPIGTAWQKLPRIVRDLARELGKQIELEQIGADTELDRQVLDQIKDPLIHMVRNSADHGLETPEARRAAGKPEKGVIRLSAYHEGGHVIVEIADDGRGLDVVRIKSKVVEKGLAGAGEVMRMPDSQIFRYIFHAGFSTAATVTGISGRGVGMDVVRANIEAIGGAIEVRSRAGEGSVFVIKIPLTLAIVPALIVRASGERFALPQSAVLELVRAQPGTDHAVTCLKDVPVLCLRDKLLPIVALSSLLALEPAVNTGSCEPWRDVLIVVLQVGAQSFGVVVDAVDQTEEIVVKPMSSALRQVPMVSGCTILGDGRVIMILDPAGLARSAAAHNADAADALRAAEDLAPRETRQEKTSLLLFRAGPREIRAVPLSLVTRIEELDASAIELVKGYPVIQYRGALIPVLYANEKVRRVEGGSQPMLVFSADGHGVMGLLVDEIVDIVETVLDMELAPSGTPEVLGAAVVAGRATEILDVAFYLADAFGQRFERRVRVADPLKLLLVDDSAFHRDLLTPVLAGSGYDVTTCTSAREALDRLEQRHYDALISDVELPDMDGFSLAAAVRGNPLSRNLPIIAVSTTCDHAAIARGRSAGFTEYVAKYDRYGLIAALKEFAGREGAVA